MRENPLLVEGNPAVGYEIVTGDRGFESTSLQRRVGSELGSDAPGVMESGAAVGSTKAKHDPLIVPGKRQT